MLFLSLEDVASDIEVEVQRKIYLNGGIALRIGLNSQKILIHSHIQFPLHNSSVRTSEAMAFPLFNSFPPEIHSLILSSCAPNDRTCLSLTWYSHLKCSRCVTNLFLASTSTNSTHQKDYYRSATKRTSHRFAQSLIHMIHGLVVTYTVKNATKPASLKQLSAMSSLDCLSQSQENAGRTAGHCIVNAFTVDPASIRD